jgi:hypothetical protein
VPFYFINLLPTSLLYISILLTCARVRCRHYRMRVAGNTREKSPCRWRGCRRRGARQRRLSARVRIRPCMIARGEIELTRRFAFPLVAMPAARRPPPRPCQPPWPLLMFSWPLLMPSSLLPGCRVKSAAWELALAYMCPTQRPLRAVAHTRAVRRHSHFCVGPGFEAVD